MKLFFAFLVVFSLRVEARVSLYDLIIEGHASEFEIKESCAEVLKNTPREKFNDSEIQSWIRPLNQIVAQPIFFHYTNADIFLNIFEYEERDREYVQRKIDNEKRFESIMLHSYKSKGVNAAGAGFYLATDPFTSRRYGSIQLRVNLKSDARTLFDPTNTKVKSLLQRMLRSNGLNECEGSDVVTSLFLQENNIDVVFFERKENWLILLNEDIVMNTDMVNPIHSWSEVYKEMMKANRLNEARNSVAGAGETRFTSHLHYINRCDDTTKITDHCQWTKEEFERFLEELVGSGDLNSVKKFLGHYLYFDLKDMDHLAKIILEVKDKELKKTMTTQSCYSIDARDPERTSLIDVMIRDADKKHISKMKKLKKSIVRSFKSEKQ